MRAVFFLFLLSFTLAPEKKSADKLVQAYPFSIHHISENYVYFHDGTKLIYDDKIAKGTAELLEKPDIQDQFFYTYTKGSITENQLSDAGRIRNEAFFKKMYGATREAVVKNLVNVVWCPKLVNQTLQFSKVNNAHLELKAISEELDKHPEWKKYLTNIGGTFNWRYINGTKRLSNHSFGITIDLNTSYSNYWQWACGCTDENAKPKYQNKIPQGIVDIFEKHGFIWGGKWSHFDTMHFEYRPELL